MSGTSECGRTSGHQTDRGKGRRNGDTCTSEHGRGIESWVIREKVVP